MRALVEALHSLLIALAAGGSVAVLIVVLICLIAFVAGSAYGIFFAAEAPGEDAFTVQQAVEQLGGEYRDYLQQIESTMPHDRQEIKANDDVYYIRWQDVLAVFSSYVSGAEDGAPVAYLDESRLQQLRQTMWDMNEVAYSTYTETVEIEADEPAGDENTDSGDSSKNPGEDTESGNGTESAAAKTVTQTVLLIELTHKTPDEMAQDYAYTARQQEYLDLLRAPEYETLWAELLGGFLSGGGEILAPAGAWQSTGPLQWPLPITGSITSPFGYRTDPITGEVSYHSGTDIAAPAGTPILAAAGRPCQGRIGRDCTNRLVLLRYLRKTAKNKCIYFNMCRALEKVKRPGTFLLGGTYHAKTTSSRLAVRPHGGRQARCPGRTVELSIQRSGTPRVHGRERRGRAPLRRRP